MRMPSRLRKKTCAAVCSAGMTLFIGVMASLPVPTRSAAMKAIKGASYAGCDGKTAGWAGEDLVAFSPDGKSAYPNPVAPAANRLTLAYTVDTDGYLQACGCTARQAGGLARRATVLRGLREDVRKQGSAWLLVDGGNLSNSLSRSEAVLDSMKLMNYAAVATGWEEERLGDAFFQLADAYQAPLLRLDPLSSATATKALFRPFRVFRVKDHRIAVLSLPRGPWETYRTRLGAVLRDARQTAEVVVAFSALTADEEKTLVAAPEVQGRLDVLIGMRGAPERKSLQRNGVTLLPATAKGEVGIAEIMLDKPGGKVEAQRLVEVRDDIPEDTEIAGIVSLYFSREYEKLRTASQAPGVDWRKIGYEAPQRCASCHVSAFQTWEKTKHSLAGRTLQLKGRLVSQCLTCHSELYRRTGKFNENIEAAWHGVSCTTCHGDGVLHTAVRSKASITRNPGEATCRKCHDPANDPHFDYPSYLERIRHW